MNRPVVFLHGWAQSRQIWCNQLETFADALFLNLPGHGGAADFPADAWVETIVEQLPDKPCHLVGWSLGGMLAMQIAAAFPERIASLALVSTTPRFRIGENWPFGSSSEVFNGFRMAVESASPKALNRFFALMLHGDELNRSDYNRLAKAAVDREKRVSEAGLKGGLELLEQLDLRELVKAIKQPTLVIHGEGDAIVPVEAGQWLADMIPNSQQQLFNTCGHAPFLTQEDKFNKTVQTWWLKQ
ncbi:carboxylesterase BioH (pimeloyl-CoA synthesis) [Mariprofundus aestuarium]|uniref:Carboxylesterase BioH (Pimeloyl-CoA synthesis) n=1 Tax=Mariprofundus aestuarium TaxID=1921086 RepID=A0A2K8KUP9_MARES|nr:alpha/beta fold hydrolase [Mariprofundus aestuarium]ATX78465.1 carboxylesterase BioH (pimeloyl-CoA synthesis) [Mariprofundus aestuarium]